jgi:hypothetical protein
MYEWNSKESRQGEKVELDSRLAGYYGPDLQEQPLPQSSWLRLQANLGSQRSSARFKLRKIMRRRNTRSQRVPGYIQDAYFHIVHEARVMGRPPVLRCSLKGRTSVPSVHNSFLGKRTMKLVLPLNAASAMESTSLQVLIATGLARFSCRRRWDYWLLRLLLAAVVVLTCTTLVLFAVYHYAILALLIAILINVVVAVLVNFQRRRMAFRADELMVRWLGRSRVCRGLHILAGRSRTRRHRLWGEPSLDERIERVCGTRVEVEDERLILVR